MGRTGWITQHELTDMLDILYQQHLRAWKEDKKRAKVLMKMITLLEQVKELESKLD